MTKYKSYILLCSLLGILLFANNAALGQYTLVPASGSTLCAPAIIGLSGSQTGVSYQLYAGNGFPVGSPVQGSGGAINFPSYSGNNGTSLYVMQTSSQGTFGVTGGSYTFVSSPSGTVSASSTTACLSNPVVFTANISGNSTYSYQWRLNGSAIPGAINSTYSTAIAGTYSLFVSSSCGSVTLSCPAFTVLTSPNAPGSVTGTASVANGSQWVYTVTASSNATSYSWWLGNPSAGSISGSGTSVTISWNPLFSGPVTVNASANIVCSTSYTPETVTVLPPVAGVQPPSRPANDYNLNWIYARSYDESGAEIRASKSFFDNNGKGIQTQSKNETANSILAAQTIYDVQGKAAVTTLAAPINNSAFAYNGNFVNNSTGTVYDYTNFDWNTNYSSTVPYSKTISPDPVQNTMVGSLGWYYSNNNSLEPMVATTGYPYSRGDFYHDGSGAAKRSAGVGDPLKMGSGHEVTSNSMPVQNELNNYLTIRNKFFPSGAVPTTLAGQALQSISSDPNGLSAVSITDLSGKQGMMSARADAISPWLTVTNTLSLSNVMAGYSFNAVTFYSDATHSPNPPGNGGLYIQGALGFSINSANNVTVSSGGTGIYYGPGNQFVYTPVVYSTTFQINSTAPFTVSASNGSAPVYDQAEAQYTEPAGTAIQYFQLTALSVVNITGTYTLYNMLTDENTPVSFTSGNTLPAGDYKVMATAPVTNVTNNVTVSYTNKYSDISYNYYNQPGQLIASIAPNGVKALITNGLAPYATAIQVPFITLYEYDLQGRVTAVTTPDGGRSQFIYRQDGKIRFSQNAYQKNSLNAGPGNAEKFSYTNYDNIGRAIESGEYAVPTATFANLAANTTILEATDPTGGLSGGTKLSQVNTYYDVPATNLTLTGYTQDPGFLKGAVSYTSNSNSTTWYNYDDHGRVIWTVKLIAGLTGYKTVDYTYNDQGNVLIVDYQKGTASERFTHYYSYDADGRLVNVQTSTNGGTTKIQQAAYYYYLHGPLKRTELGTNLQGIDYVYTPQGWLKAINSPTGNSANDPRQDGVGSSPFAKDAFGMQIEYFPNDYVRSGSNVTNIPTGTQSYYDGNVSGMSWQSNKPASVVSGNPNIQNPAMYTYLYDPKYQFTGSTWGAPNFTAPTFTPSSTNIFQEKQIAYDANGNIQTMQHTGLTGALVDNFSYNYTANTNKLASVANAVGPSTYGTYTYDETGRLKSQVAVTATTYLKYDVTGKITGIYTDAAFTNLKIGYTYDEIGNRIASINNTGSQPITTYYVYDASGKVMAIYTQSGTNTPAIAEIPVCGSTRLGTYFVAAANYVYEIRDNAGSVRLAINGTKVSGQADIRQYDDYYPYGSVAQSGGVGYRYDYQGANAEKDPVTGYNNFKLRMYDGRIGRWLSVDPAGQFASPYEGMGNDPVSGSDPTGGQEVPDNEPLYDAGDWHASDRINNTDLFKSANAYNFQNQNFDQYQTKDEKTAFSSWVQVTDPGLRQYVAISIGETGTGLDGYEAAGVGSTMADRMDQAGTSLHDPNWLEKISYGGNIESNFNAVRDQRQDYTDVMNKMTIYQILTSSNTGIIGALDSFYDWGKIDYSNPNGHDDTGLYFFNATAGLANSTYGNGIGYVQTRVEGGWIWSKKQQLWLHPTTTFYRPW